MDKCTDKSLTSYQTIGLRPTVYEDGPVKYDSVYSDPQTPHGVFRGVCGEDIITLEHDVITCFSVGNVYPAS